MSLRMQLMQIIYIYIYIYMYWVGKIVKIYVHQP